MRTRHLFVTRAVYGRAEVRRKPEAPKTREEHGRCRGWRTRRTTRAAKGSASPRVDRERFGIKLNTLAAIDTGHLIAYAVGQIVNGVLADPSGRDDSSASECSWRPRALGSARRVLPSRSGSPSR